LKSLVPLRDHVVYVLGSCSWDFNMFQFMDLVGGYPLAIVFKECIQYHRLGTVLGISVSCYQCTLCPDTKPMHTEKNTRSQPRSAPVA
jgi:hypothetical protein